jgi:hypothetical protein
MLCLSQTFFDPQDSPVSIPIFEFVVFGGDLDPDQEARSISVTVGSAVVDVELHHDPHPLTDLDLGLSHSS